MKYQSSSDDIACKVMSNYLSYYPNINLRSNDRNEQVTVVEYKYARETYTLYLVANDGHETYIYPKYQEKLDGSSLATRDGYTLGGWFYDAELTDEADITELSFKKGETITLYATNS